MGTKRMPVGRPPRSHVTPEAIELFKRGMAIEALGLDEIEEECGGRHREYLDLRRALRQALGQTKPWDVNVFDVADGDSMHPAWETEPTMIKAYRKASALRKALLETVGDYEVEVPD
jgi:hypothetical protein